MAVCILLEAPQATAGALDPYGPPFMILFFPIPWHTHTHTHTHSHGTEDGPPRGHHAGPCGGEGTPA